MASNATNKKVAAAKSQTIVEQPKSGSKSSSTFSNSGSRASSAITEPTVNGGALDSGGATVASPSTPTGTPGHTDTTTVAPSPFLTGAQQAQYDATMQGYQDDVAGWQSQEASAKLDEGKQEAAQNYAAAVSAANQNALAAARGMFGSGVNASQLSDINTTLHTNLSTLQSQLSSLTTQLDGQIASEQANGDKYNATVAYYNGLAADNAAGETPTTQTTDVPGTGSYAPVTSSIGTNLKSLDTPQPTVQTTPGKIQVPKTTNLATGKAVPNGSFGANPVNAKVAKNFSSGMASKAMMSNGG